MNIRRGLFRVWVGLTLVWVCLVSLIAFADGQKYFRPIRLTVAKYEIEFPGTAPREIVQTTLVKFLKTEAQDYRGDPEKDAAEISQQFRSEDFGEFITRIATLLVTVPLAVFAFGWLLLWIGAGFNGGVER